MSLFGARTARKLKEQARDHPMPKAELDALRLRVAALHRGPLLQDLAVKLKAEEDWRWAERRERLETVIARVSLAISAVLFAAVAVWALVR